MGKKIKLPFLSKTITNTSTWPWPSCHQPRTLSFRNCKNDSSAHIDGETTHESSLFTNTSSSESATASPRGDPIENVIRGLRSTERLFFEPNETSSILEEANKCTTTSTPFKESLVLSMESKDPYIDFKKSMEEMVEAHGLKDWKDLEELLCWFLNMNGKSNHGYIVNAFVDQLVALAFASSSSSNINGDFITCSSSSSSSTSCSPASLLSFYTSSFSSDDSSSTPCLSSLLEAEAEDVHEVQKQQNDDDASSS